jgi:plasmid stability protein
MPGHLICIGLQSNNLLITVGHDMTLTVKLDAHTEQSLRLRIAASGRSVSDIMREALLQWLAQTPAPDASAYALGADLFGKHTGPADLATQRKAELLKAWDAKRPLGNAKRLSSSGKAKKS